MFGGFGANPVQSLPLTVVTSHLVIQGTIQTRLRRLTDVLNEPDVAYLVLMDASFMEIGSRRLVARAGVSQVQLDDVLFAHVTAATESAAEMRTPKQAVRATLLAPPFTVEGQIHLAYESDLRLAMESYSGRFLPVTGAKYWAYGVAEAPNYVDLLVVNHARAHVSVASGVEWQSEAPLDGGSGSTPNPW
ncbi:MAG: hypothetical protein ACXWN4_01915 [Candidatus Limnocylindrales bacterium]